MPQRILQVVLALMEEVFDLIRIDVLSNLLLHPMVQEQDMPVPHVHLHLTFVVGLSIKRKQTLVEQGSNNQGDAINQ